MIARLSTRTNCHPGLALCHSRESGNPALAIHSWIPGQARGDNLRRSACARVTALAVMLLILVSCTSSKPHQPEIKYAFDGKTLSVKVQLPEGLHAYGPGEPVGRPVKLVIHPTNHWSLSSAPHIPAGDSNHMLSHAFEIKAQLKDGHGPVVGTFKMQLCSNTSCERPQDYAFQVGL